MRYGKIMVCLLTAAFLAAAVFFWSREPGREREIPLSVTVSGAGGTETIRCRDNGWGEYYVYLPSFAEVSQLALQWEGAPVAEELGGDGFQLDTRYELTSEDGRVWPVTFVRSANVPALYLDVRSGAMDYIHREKGNSESGNARLYTREGALDYSGNFTSLDGRGSSTWSMEKKPYNLELSTEGDLLGMGAAKKWVLLANAADPSQLRNKIVYDFARKLGLDYSPECRWVDLYLNGEYAGLYLLCERNEVHTERVDLTGERYFLVSKEWEWRMDTQKQPYVQLSSNAALRLHDTNMEAEEVQAVFQSAENAILAADGIDPVTGKHWRELIDVDSWALKYLIEEVFGNVDGGTLSQFYYYDGGKIFAGPVWDYDLTMGNTFAYPYPTANMFYVNQPGIYATQWYPTLYENPEFYSRMTELYETVFRPLLEALSVEEYGAEIAQAAKRNALRWNETDPAAEVAYIGEYLAERMAFLDSLWLEGEPYVTALVVTADDTLLSFRLRPGDTLPELPSYESTDTWIVHGWYTTGTEKPFDITTPIYEDTAIYLKHSTVEVQTEEESPSLLRLGPAILFLAALAGLGLWDRKRTML